MSRTALYYAAGNGHTAIIAKLLAAGAYSNITNNIGRTDLDYAREHRHVTIIKLLEEHMKKAIS